MVELDKSQKKIARTLISRALERECCTFLAKLKRLLQDAKEQYDKAKEFLEVIEKYIAENYQ